MRFKGLLIKRMYDGQVEVTPLYHAKRGATIKARGLAKTADTVRGAVGKVLPVLLGRKDVRE